MTNFGPGPGPDPRGGAPRGPQVVCDYVLARPWAGKRPVETDISPRSLPAATGLRRVTDRVASGCGRPRLAKRR